MRFSPNLLTFITYFSVQGRLLSRTFDLGPLSYLANCAIELNKKSKAVQVAQLFTRIEEEGHDVYSTFCDWANKIACERRRV